MRDRKPELRITEPPDPVYAGRAGKAIQARLLELPEYKNARRVFCYVSMDSEPETRDIIRHAISAGKTVSVPVCFRKPHMTAVTITGLEGLAKGAYGIYEPRETCAAMLPHEIDIAVIPCVRAGKDGARLGHGAGYYDRFLEGSSCYRVCLCFEKNLCDDIPMTDTDVRMDCVITENGVYYSQ